MSVWASRSVAAVLLCGLLYAVPLVRLRPLRDEAIPAADEFEPRPYARRFWEEQLSPAIDEALEAGVVVAALGEDAAAFGDDHGVRVGVGRGFYLFLQGEGVVAEANSKGVLVRLALDGEVRLRTGPLFGSAIRDATGLLQSEVAPTSRDYNALANELNQLAEERAVAALATANVGDKVRFAGCAKVADPSRYAAPLEVLPVMAVVE